MIFSPTLKVSKAINLKLVSEGGAYGQKETNNQLAERADLLEESRSVPDFSLRVCRCDEWHDGLSHDRHALLAVLPLGHPIRISCRIPSQNGRYCLEE